MGLQSHEALLEGYDVLEGRRLDRGGHRDPRCRGAEIGRGAADQAGRVDGRLGQVVDRRQQRVRLLERDGGRGLDEGA